MNDWDNLFQEPSRVCNERWRNLSRGCPTTPTLKWIARSVLLAINYDVCVVLQERVAIRDNDIDRQMYTSVRKLTVCPF